LRHNHALDNVGVSWDLNPESNSGDLLVAQGWPAAAAQREKRVTHLRIAVLATSDERGGSWKPGVAMGARSEGKRVVCLEDESLWSRNAPNSLQVAFRNVR
jgi:hypothetical protein